MLSLIRHLLDSEEPAALECHLAAFSRHLLDLVARQHDAHGGMIPAAELGLRLPDCASKLVFERLSERPFALDPKVPHCAGDNFAHALPLGRKNTGVA